MFASVVRLQRSSGVTPGSSRPFARLGEDVGDDGQGQLMAASRASIVEHVKAMLDFQKKGAEVFDNGNLIRTQAREGGVENAFDIPIFTEAYLRPLFARAIGPFRWMALSGAESDIARIRRQDAPAQEQKLDRAFNIDMILWRNLITTVTISPFANFSRSGGTTR